MSDFLRAQQRIDTGMAPSGTLEQQNIQFQEQRRIDDAKFQEQQHQQEEKFEQDQKLQQQDQQRQQNPPQS